MLISGTHKLSHSFGSREVVQTGAVAGGGKGPSYVNNRHRRAFCPLPISVVLRPHLLPQVETQSIDAETNSCQSNPTPTWLRGLNRPVTINQRDRRDGAIPLIQSRHRINSLLKEGMNEQRSKRSNKPTIIPYEKFSGRRRRPQQQARRTTHNFKSSDDGFASLRLQSPETIPRIGMAIIQQAHQSECRGAARGRSVSCLPRQVSVTV